MQLSGAGAINSSRRNIEIWNHIRILNNAGWGVFNQYGDVYINVHPDIGNAISLKQSIISGNGDTNKPCYYHAASGKPITEGPVVKLSIKADQGGIAANGGRIGLARVEVSGNKRGPGLYAKMEAKLSLAKILSNRGPGVQVVQGMIEWAAHSEDKIFKNQVIGNSGPGLFTGVSFNLFKDTTTGGNIILNTDIEIRDNAGWGVFSEHGDVCINMVPNMAVLVDRPSLIVSNGNERLPCYYHDKEGDFNNMRSRRGKGGGIGAARGEISAGLVDISGNSLGGGVVAFKGVDVRSFKIRGNNGPGIQSASWYIKAGMSPKTFADGNIISDNSGPGILLGTSIFDAGFASQYSPLEVLTPVTIIGNAGWGIMSGLGPVHINMIDYSMPTSTNPVVVANCGRMSLPCQYYDNSGELQITSRQGGGILAAKGNILAASLILTNNIGVGFSAHGDIYQHSGILGNNTRGDYTKTSSVKILPEVVRFDQDKDGIGNDVEADAPNTGDGNWDGIPDNQQLNVASFQGITGSYLTVAAGSTAIVSDVACVTQVPLPNVPPSLDFPVGIIHFNLTNSTPGNVGGKSLRQNISAQSVTVEIILPKNIQFTGYYLFGPTPDQTNAHWYPFDYDGSTGAELLPDRIRIHFIDGDRGDADLTINQTIAHSWGGPVSIPKPLVVRLLSISKAPSDILKFSVTSSLSKPCVLEYSNNLRDWIPILDIMAGPDPVSVEDFDPLNDVKGFYRVRAL